METILIVDDTKINILDGLLNDNYNIVSALNGNGAFEIIKENSIDLILLDILMPNMDGYEICTRLKENPQTQDIPVIFITSKTDDESIERAYKVGGIDYVVKPFRPIELLSKVKREISIKALKNPQAKEKEKSETEEKSIAVDEELKSILIVDDKQINLKILFGLLGEEYDIITTLDGHEVFEIVEEEHIDLILLDIAMPNIDGYKVCKLLKENPKTKDIPIIFITAKTDEESIEKAYDIGGADYITKPFKPKELLSKIKKELLVVDLIGNLENKIKLEVERNRQQEIAMVQQNRLAQMGEMIGAIAHQWRQPLNVISTSIQNLKYDYKDGYLNDEKFVKEFIDKQKETIRFMSNTIDDFRNFFRVDKDKQEFKVKKATQSVLDMLSAQLEEYAIGISIQGDEFEYYGLVSEYQQVALNIITNAKDALLENNTENPNIEIIIEDGEVTIQDNAGGIPKDILDRVFEPYFTTKEQGKGTGMGLYMSKMIIVDNMSGELRVVNGKNGAIFTIDFSKNRETKDA